MAKGSPPKSAKSINWKVNVENVKMNVEKFTVWYGHLCKNLIFTSVDICVFSL